MRLLVLDQSRILPWIVEHDLVDEADVRVESVTSFEEAERIVRATPPDAVVVSMPAAQVDWRHFQHLCASSSPPVPVLYESCLPDGARKLGLEPPEGQAFFLPKPAPTAELHRALRTLIEVAQSRATGDRAALARIEH